MLLLHQKYLALLAIAVTTCAAGWYPLYRHRAATHQPFADHPYLEALASGIFLGASLLHMLSTATRMFHQAHYTYPLAALLACSVFLLLLLLEHIGRELHVHRQDAHLNAIAYVTTGLLSLHSVLAGIALGMTTETVSFTMVLIAILAHKWATSLALAVHIRRASLSRISQLSLFTLYATMAPFGVLVGQWGISALGCHNTWVAVFSALSAGTFLYIGTLHGLQRAVMVERCCNLREFAWMILGFATMALLAAWT